MDEKLQQTQPLAVGPRIINLVGDQRANNLISGHFGRLSYVPLEDVDNKDYSSHSKRSHGIGKLHVNRIIEQTLYSFRELPPFEGWYPPTRSVLSGDGQQVTKHLAWLWKKAPEAVVGTITPWNGLRREIKAVTSAKQDESKLPLLACGEIANMQGWDISSCPAIAMAAGHSGHILRVVKVQNQELYWKPATGTSITIDAFIANGAAEGHWCGGSLPIRQVQFVTCRSANNVSRLVMVQTSTATTFFEPVLQTASIQEHDKCGYVSRGPSNIAINPVMQINAEDTGGEAHCDAAFRPGSEDKMSQLAIIDERGNWNVWDIKANPNTSTDKFHPMFVAKGNFLDGMPSMRSLTGIYERRHIHRIAWLPTAHKQAKFPPPPMRVQTAHSTSVSNAPSSTLMLLNAAYLKTVDIKTRKNLQTFGLTSHDGVDMVLDMQPCPTKSTRIFVLTTTTLFWLDLEPSVTDRKTLPKTPSKVTRPAVLLSCPHLRDPTEKTLKLCVAPLGQLRHRGTCLVLVYSTVQAEMNVFWFTEGAWGGQASFRHQLFRFNAPPNTPSGTKEEESAYGEQTLLAFPRDFAVEYGQRSWKHRRRHTWQDSEKLRVFQFLRLGEDLGFRSSVCIRSPTLDSTASLSLKRVPVRIRKKAQKLYNSSFVVPDGMDDPLIAEQQKPRPIQKPTGLLVPSTKRDFRTMDLSAVFKLLSGQMATVSETAREAADVVRGFQNPSPLDVIRRIIKTGLGRGSYPFTTLLDAVEDNFISSFGADLTDLSWFQRLADLDLETDRRVYIYGQMNDGIGINFHNVTTLYQVMADMCATADETASARLSGLLEVATVRLFLSLISMAVAPRPAVLLGNSIGSSLATPVPENKSPTLPTPETWHSAVDLDIPSSPPNIAEWLQFSQESTGDPAVAVEMPAEAVEEAQIEVAEDATIARLRQYAVSIKTEPPRTTGELSLLSHWQLGSDPSQVWWRSAGPAVRRSVVEDAELAQIEEEEARERRRKRNEKLAARERERMMRMGVEDGGSMGMLLPRRRIQHSQQMELPPMPSSPAPMSSQVFSSQVVQSSQAIVSSQPFGGGLQRSRAKKKVKRTGGFR